MLSPANSTVTAACVVAMMMVMTMAMDAAAVPHRGHKRSENAEVETVPLQLDHSSMVLNKSIRSLENASISPWTWHPSSDETLFPQPSEARCLLKGCLNSEGHEDRNLESKPIMHQVLVLRRVRSPNREHGYYFKLESRLITVGCTCIRPIVQHQQ